MSNIVGLSRSKIIQKFDKIRKEALQAYKIGPNLDRKLGLPAISSITNLQSSSMDTLQ